MGKSIVLFKICYTDIDLSKILPNWNLGSSARRQFATY